MSFRELRNLDRGTVLPRLHSEMTTMAEDQLMVEELQAALLAARSQLKQKDHDLEEAKTRLERLKTTAEIDQLHAMER